MNKRESRARFPARILYLALALTLAAALLYFSLRGLDWSSVATTLRSARLDRIVLWIGMGTLSLLLRAARWRLLLSATRPVEFGIAFWATCAGYFGNSFLPARAGELVRTMAVSVRTGLRAAYVLTTALSERIVDAVALVLISSAVLLLLPYRPGWFESATRVFVPLGLGGALCIALVPKIERLWRLLLKHLPVPDRLRPRISNILDQVMEGSSVLHDPKRLTAFLGLTAVIWFTDGIGIVIGCWSLGISISILVAFLLMAGLGLGSALPSTPGYVGIYQFVAVSILTPFGVAKADAIAFILLAQASQYFGTTVWGLIAFSKLGGLKRWTHSQAEVFISE